MSNIITVINSAGVAQQVDIANIAMSDFTYLGSNLESLSFVYGGETYTQTFQYGTGGVITGTSIGAGGNFSAISLPLIAGNPGANATFSPTFQMHSGPAINSGGTGYTAGDTLTVVGGTGTAATVLVGTVNGSGVIQTASLATAGAYSVIPSPATAVHVTGGTGNSATFNLTFLLSALAVTNGGGLYTSGSTIDFSSVVGTAPTVTLTVGTASTQLTGYTPFLVQS